MTYSATGQLRREMYRPERPGREFGLARLSEPKARNNFSPAQSHSKRCSGLQQPMTLPPTAPVLPRPPLLASPPPLLRRYTAPCRCPSSSAAEPRCLPAPRLGASHGRGRRRRRRVRSKRPASGLGAARLRCRRRRPGVLPLPKPSATPSSSRRRTCTFTCCFDPPAGEPWPTWQ